MSNSYDFVQRVCPLCGARGPARSEVASQRRAEAMAFDELVPHWNGFFKEKVFFTYHRCSDCQLLFNPMFFDPKQLDKLYLGMPPNMESVPTEALERTQIGYFNWLKANAAFKNGYLEVGPDVGAFVRYCVERGGFDHYWLFEPNRDVAAALGQVVLGEAHTIVHEMSGFQAVPDESVGVVVMIHVLDHLLDPMSALAELRRKLAPGGKVLVVTHNEASLLRRAIGKMWPPFCLQHPQLFRPQTIKTMLTASGFVDVRVRRAVNHFPVSFLAKHLLWALGLRWDVNLHLDATVGLRLGNMITLATAA